jgi:hypothetical protein
MSEMIERVGRALAEQEGYAYDPLPYDARARAAIEAMREPTEGMVTAGGVQRNCFSCGGHVEGWQLMIDAALK